eukprot:3496405-Alexandrium_andersonii.AAC.1
MVAKQGYDRQGSQRPLGRLPARVRPCCCPAGCPGHDADVQGARRDEGPHGWRGQRPKGGRRAD